MISYKSLNEEVAQRLVSRQNKAVYPEPFVQFGPENVFLPKFYGESAHIIEGLEVREDDVWICSFIKAGTTWTKEMAWIIQHDMDFEGAACQSYLRIPYLEFDATWPVRSISEKLNTSEEDNQSVVEEKEKSATTMSIVANMESPRTIQSHLPWSLLPRQIREGLKRPKIIYVARNPKDVCVSFFHHRVLIEGWKGTLDEFVEEFTDDLSFYGPFWSHVKSFWERRTEPNILFLTYEEMKADLAGVIGKTVAFLGKSINEADKARLLDHLSFESMKKNPYINLDEVTALLTTHHGVPRKSHFIRKGKVGGWKEELSPEAVERLDAWVKRNRISGLWETVL